MSEVPCTSVRAAIGVRSAMTVEAATVAHDQPSPSRKRPVKICHDVPSGDSPHSASETSSTTPPATRTGLRPKRSAAHPTIGREGEHAEHVDRDDEADHLEVRAAVLHVERRHDHHRHHRRVRARHRDDRRTDRRHVAHDLDEARPRPAARLRRRRSATTPAAACASEERVGAQPPPHPAGGEDEHDRADGEAAGQLGDAQGRARPSRRRRRGWARPRRRSCSPTRRARAPARGAPRSRGRWRRSATPC